MPRQRAAGVRASIPLTPIPIAAAKLDSPTETATSIRATIGQRYRPPAFSQICQSSSSRFTRSRPRGSHHDSGLEHAYQDDDQGGQHDEDGDEVDGDDPLALGRDAGEDDRRLPGVGVPAG